MQWAVESLPMRQSLREVQGLQRETWRGTQMEAPAPGPPTVVQSNPSGQLSIHSWVQMRPSGPSMQRVELQSVLEVQAQPMPPSTAQS